MGEVVMAVEGGRDHARKGDGQRNCPISIQCLAAGDIPSAQHRTPQSSAVSKRNRGLDRLYFVSIVFVYLLLFKIISELAFAYLLSVPTLRVADQSLLPY